MVSGTWNLFYNFGCGGTYNSATITFNPPGTFIDNFGGQGVWFQNNGTMVILYTTHDKPAWAGNVAGSVMTGARIFPSGATGCWYATQFGSAQATISADDKAHVPPGSQAHSKG